MEILEKLEVLKKKEHRAYSKYKFNIKNRKKKMDDTKILRNLESKNKILKMKPHFNISSMNKINKTEMLFYVRERK